MNLRALFAIALPAALLCFSVGCGDDSTNNGKNSSNNSSDNNSSDNSGDDGGGAYACTQDAGGFPTCTYAEYGDSVPQSSIDAAKDACTQAGGTASDSCPSADLLGCCQSAASGATAYACYYKGTLYKSSDDVKMACEQASQKYVAKP